MMKLKIWILLLLPLFTGCSSCRIRSKVWQADIIGLDRSVTLYNERGEALEEWPISGIVISDGGSSCFVDKEGRLVRISGTFTVKEAGE